MPGIQPVNICSHFTLENVLCPTLLPSTVPYSSEDEHAWDSDTWGTINALKLPYKLVNIISLIPKIPEYYSFTKRSFRLPVMARCAIHSEQVGIQVMKLDTTCITQNNRPKIGHTYHGCVGYVIMDRHQWEMVEWEYQAPLSSRLRMITPVPRPRDGLTERIWENALGLVRNRT